jgi:hypothetical protein
MTPISLPIPPTAPALRVWTNEVLGRLYDWNLSALSN